MRVWSNDPNFVFYLVNFKQDDILEAQNAAYMMTKKLKELGYFKFQETFINLQAMIEYAKAL